MDQSLVLTGQGEIKRRPLSCHLFQWNVDVLGLAARPVQYLANHRITSDPCFFYDSIWRFAIVRVGGIEELPNGTKRAIMRIRFAPEDIEEWKKKGLIVTSQFELSFDSGYAQWNGKSVLKGDMIGFGQTGIEFHVVFATQQDQRPEKETILASWKLFIQHTSLNISGANTIPFFDDLPNEMDQLFEDGPFKDLTVKCGVIHFRVHKAILAGSSNVFKAMLDLDMKEAKENVIRIAMKSFDDQRIIGPAVVKAMLKWIYTRLHPTIDQSEWKDLIILADAYELKHLKAICISELARGLSKESVIEDIILSDLLRLDVLKKIAFEFFLRNTDIKRELIESGQFDRLTEEIKVQLMLSA